MKQPPKDKDAPAWSDEELQEWREQDLWTEREVQALLCGLKPNPGRPSTEETNKANEAISRAVDAGNLKPIYKTNMTTGEAVHGSPRSFKPTEVIGWAQKRFPKFPFRVEEKPITQTERNTLLILIGALLQSKDIDHASPTAAGKLSQMTERFGAKVTDETCRKYLDQISEAQERRNR
jgi:hypothetical protein